MIGKIFSKKLPEKTELQFCIELELYSKYLVLTPS